MNYYLLFALKIIINILFNMIKNNIQYIFTTFFSIVFYF